MDSDRSLLAEAPQINPEELAEAVQSDPTTGKAKDPHSEPNHDNRIQRKKIRWITAFGCVLIVAMAIVSYFTLNHRSNNYYRYADIQLGMTVESAQRAIPKQGMFRTVTIIGEDGAESTIQYLECKHPPEPWSRLLVGAIDGRVVSISGYLSDISLSTHEQIINDFIKRYGRWDGHRRNDWSDHRNEWLELEDDNGFDGYDEIWYWGDVKIEIRGLLHASDISGRAIILNQAVSGDSHSCSFRITRDGDGPY